MIIGPRTHSFSPHISIFIIDGKEIVETKNCFKLDLAKGKAGVYITDDKDKPIPVLDGKSFKSEEYLLSHIELNKVEDEDMHSDYINVQKSYPRYLR